jgi:hypothetical protein
VIELALQFVDEEMPTADVVENELNYMPIQDNQFIGK